MVTCLDALLLFVTMEFMLEFGLEFNLECYKAKLLLQLNLWLQMMGLLLFLEQAVEQKLIDHTISLEM